MEEIFLARQPIYNRRLDLIGYELLYRDNEQDRAKFSDDSRASSRVIINTFIGLGLENIVGSNPAYINISDGFLLDGQPIPMSAEQIVLELRGDHLPDEAVMDKLRQLVAQGYRIALDHFSYEPKLAPLLELASVVKLDLERFGYTGLTEQVSQCRQYPLALMAEKVESQEDLQFCCDLGIDYFQGYFFCKPQLMRGRAEPANRAVVLQLLSKLQQPEVEIGELEHLIIQDVALTYKLLRYLNCATYALRREIDSVRDALVLIGTNTVRKWAVLLLMSEQANDKPRELISTAMLRARMCELLAPQLDCSAEMAFTVGLFSTLDAIMDTPMDELLDTIALRSEIKLALSGREGALGQLLAQVLDYEAGNWEQLDTDTVEASAWARSYLEAVSWANEHSGAMGA